MAVDRELLAAWCRMWARSRGVGAPEPHGSGFRTRVGLPGQSERFVFPQLQSAEIRALCESIRDPTVVVKVCAPADEVEALLPERWEIGQPRFFMTGAVEQVEAVLAAGYSLSVTEQETAIVVQVFNREHSIVGRLGLLTADRTAVLDRLEVDEAHRGRGLAAALVARAQTEAAARGAHYGVLAATAAGRPIYERFGWRSISDYTTATLAN